MTGTYAQIQRVLHAAHSLTEPAEAHGTLAGALCSTVTYGFEDWIREILPDGYTSEEAVDALREVYQGTAAALAGSEMEFQPLLPEDEQPLNERTAALAQWCLGFLYGLGTSAVQDVGALPGDVGEIVRDFEEISRAAVEGGESDERDENAYAELVEFVRVGVQLVFEELEPLRDRATPPPSGSLH